MRKLMPQAAAAAAGSQSRKREPDEAPFAGSVVEQCNGPFLRSTGASLLALRPRACHRA